MNYDMAEREDEPTDQLNSDGGTNLVPHRNSESPDSDSKLEEIIDAG